MVHVAHLGGCVCTRAYSVCIWACFVFPAWSALEHVNFITFKIHLTGVVCMSLM